MISVPAMTGTNRKAKPTAADVAAAQRLKAEWLRHARALELTQDKMAAILGGTQGLVSQYLNGLIPLNYRALLLFCKALGIEPEQVRTDLPEQQLTPKSADLGDWTSIEASLQGVAAGGGRVPDDYAETHRLLFRQDSLRRKGLKQPHLQVHYVSGDSMSPRLRNGDAILIDTSDTRIRDGSIYWIRYEGEHYVKQLHKAGKSIVIESMNKQDPQWRTPIVVQPGDDFAVVGRVRWVGSWED